MIDTDDSIWRVLTCPIAGWITSITTTTVGAFNFNEFELSLSSINSLMATISMFVGICLSIAMIRAWILKGDLHALDKQDRCSYKT